MQNHPFMRGIGLGVVAGAMVGAAMMTRKKEVRHAAHKAMKKVGGVMDDMVDNITGAMTR